MSNLVRGALAGALAERVRSLRRTADRLRALDDFHEPNDHVVAKADAEAVLRGALEALSAREGYELARRLVAGERVRASDELGRAGLVTWDPESDASQPTALLVELMRILDAAVTEAGGQA